MIEAMAAGVPPLAPDVGGISDLVSNEFGILTGENPSVEEIADAIGELMKKARRPEIRQKARERVESRFNAAKNYPEFIKCLHALAAGKGGF
jgi:glycosyltransferase involved in cell wall biosynthesis